MVLLDAAKMGIASKGVSAAPGSHDEKSIWRFQGKTLVEVGPMASSSRYGCGFCTLSPITCYR